MVLLLCLSGSDIPSLLSSNLGSEEEEEEEEDVEPGRSIAQGSTLLVIGKDA